MGSTATGKLVRDRIPEIIRGDGRLANTRTLSAVEYRSALLAKLDEEVAELNAADEGHLVDELVDELADVFEVLMAIAADHGHSWETVVAAANTKREQRGGFDKRIWLMG